MRVQVNNHQDKADHLIRAIFWGGHQVVQDHADLFLVDFDGPVAHYPKIIERAYQEGAEIYLYSHGAMPLTCWDGIWTPGGYTRGYLAQTPGQKQVMAAYDYPIPIHVIGWHYCEQAPFQETEGKRVLFEGAQGSLSRIRWRRKRRSRSRWGSAASWSRSGQWSERIRQPCPLEARSVDGAPAEEE